MEFAEFKGEMVMREVNVSKITDAVKQLCIETNRILPADLEETICKACKTETNDTGKAILNDLCRNMDAAREMQIPICQDTGMAVVFVEVGQDVHFIGGDFEQAIHEGVRQGYVEGLLRLSVVGDPLERKNTNDNTPAVIHTRIVQGDKVELMVAPKGFGSENMSRIKMFTPSATKEDIINFVVETAKLAGSNPCPPMVLGVGIGGDFELCAYLAKKALCREVSEHNPKEEYRLLEQEMLERVNQLDIGPQGFGGITTALSVAIEQYATHIAGLPVAVNVGCHVTRHKKVTI
jgi:hypothetical protein